MFRKVLSVATLEIDPDSGTIWLNTTKCLLRISKLKFVNVEENFSMIDIDGSNAVMTPTDLTIEATEENVELSMFLSNITNLLSFELDNNKKIIDKNKFLENVFFKVRKVIEEEYR